MLHVLLHSSLCRGPAVKSIRQPTHPSLSSAPPLHEYISLSALYGLLPEDCFITSQARVEPLIIIAHLLTYGLLCKITLSLVDNTIHVHVIYVSFWKISLFLILMANNHCHART